MNEIGHWSFGANFYRKQLTIDYLLVTSKKPVVALINGIVMGGGAGISMHARFRIVTEKTVFAMQEVSIGLFPNVGASHFLSRLPWRIFRVDGWGARFDGSAMLACGLGTHFILSKDLALLENALDMAASSNEGVIANGADKWILDATNSMKIASPTSLKVFRHLIKVGRDEKLDQCLIREFIVLSHIMRRITSDDFFEYFEIKLELYKRLRIHS
ncbi:hypothetical protein LguiA_026142 [Lonicera macranthoides]